MDEIMETTTPEDRNAVFERVWRRVMEGREDPLAQGSLQGEGAPPIQGPEEPNREEEPGMALLPVESQQANRDRSRGDFPPGHGGVLGAGCLEHAPLLQEMIRRELRDWREYQALARRVGGPQARVFQTLANEEKGHAKRLSAAYFLISGVRYWPEGEKPPAPGSYLGALRRRFGMEQEGVAAYLAGAEATTDPCLRQLFLDHAREEWDHACRIRALVEQA